MNKHERAKQHLGVLADFYGSHAHPKTREDGEALRYALRVLEAVEGVKEWMPIEVRLAGEVVADPDLGTKVSPILQAILDAKADDA